MIAWALVAITFVISFLEGGVTGGDWRWDIGNGFGLLALAVLTYLLVDSGSGRRQRMHQHISYVALVALLLHILILWIPDFTLWHYLTPDTHHYMWAGLVATALLVFITLIALPGRRRFWHGTYPRFQRWHRWMSWAALGVCLWHIIGSGFYVSIAEGAIYSLLVLGLWIARRTDRLPKPETSLYAVCGLLLTPFLFALAKFAL